MPFVEELKRLVSLIATYPYLQGKAMQDRIFSKARLGASRKVCLQILQLLLVLQVMQQRWPFLH
jgi:hypothetical protein